MDEFYARSLDLHREYQGKIEVRSKMEVEDRVMMSLVYTPGVGHPCEVIYQNPSLAHDLTCKGNTVAVVTDGSAVLGLGNIGPLAALPVMEGKALLFKKYGGVNAWPICLDTQDPKEIIETVRRIAPSFGGINLEDIAAPACFEVEEQLQDLGIPVFHDDQHGTAAVTLAALYNACRVQKREMRELRVVIVGAGAAGIAIARLLSGFHGEEGALVKDVVLVDSSGILCGDTQVIDPVKKEALSYTNFEKRKGTLQEALLGADVVVGVSSAGVIKKEDIALMASNPIVFAMANPEPEIWPADAIAAGAAVVATGRSDLPNQVNNVQIFPGIFRGVLDARAPRITQEMIRAAAFALAEAVESPKVDQLLPSLFDLSVAPRVAEAVKLKALSQCE